VRGQDTRVFTEKFQKAFPSDRGVAEVWDGAARFCHLGGSQRSRLTGLSHLCCPSSRALWAASRRPAPAVAQSSGRVAGRAGVPAARLATPGRRPSEPRRALPAPSARRSQAAARRSRPTGTRPSPRDWSGPEGRDREGPSQVTASLPNPPPRKRKRKPAELVLLGWEANWPSR
jgi:hypothetical protein